MVNFLHAIKFRGVLLSTILASFTLAVLPQPAYSLDINLNDIGLAVRVKKLN